MLRTHTFYYSNIDLGVFIPKINSISQTLNTIRTPYHTPSPWRCFSSNKQTKPALKNHKRVSSIFFTKKKNTFIFLFVLLFFIIFFIIHSSSISTPIFWSNKFQFSLIFPVVLMNILWYLRLVSAEKLYENLTLYFILYDECV